MAIPSYTKTTWQNGTTPINEDNLNNIEDQVEAITDGVDGRLVNVDQIYDEDYKLNVIKELNLFYPDNVSNNQATCIPITDGFRVNKTTTGAGFCLFKLKDVSNYEGETFTINSTFTSGGKTIIGLCDEEGGNRIAGTTQTTSDTPVSYTIPTITTSKYLAVWLYGPENEAGDVDYTNIMVNPGSTAITYEPYGQSKVIADGEEIYNHDLSVLSKIPEYNVTLGNIMSTLGCADLGTKTQTFDLDDLQVGQACRWTTTTAQKPQNAPATGGQCFCISNFGGSGKRQIVLLYNSDAIYSRYYWGSTGWSDWTILNVRPYNTSERQIGTWIDGRPLYRKVITYTIPSGTTSIGISLGVSNIRLVQRAEVRFNSVGSGDYVFNSYYSSASDYMRFFMRSNELQIRLGANSSGMNIVAIVEYTKSTD